MGSPHGAGCERWTKESTTMRSTNPVLSRTDVFSRNGYAPTTPAGVSGGTMTLDDVVTRTGLLLVIVLATGAFSWGADVGPGLAVGAALVGFGLAMVNSFKKVPSPPLIMAYAAVEGIFLGAISKSLEAAHPGVVAQAVAGTAITFAVMLGLYRSGRVRVTPRFTKVLVGATVGYMILMFGNLMLNLFHSGGNAWGGGFGLLTAAAGAGLASFFLTLDFDMVERGIRAGAPQSEAWRAAFGLTVTLVWLYVELLRLLSILRGD
jgi:uncharacterized YccA/Bax inhibitor family protein